MPERAAKRALRGECMEVRNGGREKGGGRRDGKTVSDV